MHRERRGGGAGGIMQNKPRQDRAARLGTNLTCGRHAYYDEEADVESCCKQFLAKPSVCFCLVLPFRCG